MSDNKLVSIFAVSVFLVLGLMVVVFNPKTEHERRMELIEEQEALIRLQTFVEIKKTQKFIDSLSLEIVKDNQ
jgi:hypothetical protein